MLSQFIFSRSALAPYGVCMEMKARLILCLLVLYCFGCKKPIPSDQVDLYPIKVGKQYGYINSVGKIAIPPTFFSVNWFQENRAIVETAPGRKALIDTSGQIVFQDTAVFLHLEYQNGLVKMETKDQKTCFLDSLGNTRFCLRDSVLFAESAFSCERLLVRIEGGIFAYLDANGAEVYRFRRGFPGNYSEDRVRRSFGGRTCYFDKKGKNLFCVKGRGSDFSNHLARVEENGHVYFINRKGKKEIISLPYDLVLPFVNDFAMVKRKGKFGFINTAGTEAIPCLYDQIGYFSSDLLAVRQDKKKGKWIFVNSQNKQVIAKEFDEVVLPGFRGELAYVRQDSVWGYINKAGAFVWKSEKIQKKE